MRRIRNVGVVLVAAVLTASAAGLVLRPSPVVAEDEFLVTHVVGGVVFSVSLDKEVYEAGEKPVLTVTAKNPAEQKVVCTSEIRLLETRRLSPGARIMPLPSVAWCESLTLALKPGEARTVALKPELAAKAAHLYGADAHEPPPPAVADAR